MRKLIFALIITLIVCAVLPCLAATPEENFDTIERYINNPKSMKKAVALQALEELRGTFLSGEGVYILNTKSHKFHTTTCPYAAQIGQGNRQEYTGSRDDLVMQGYAPCSLCKP